MSAKRCAWTPQAEHGLRHTLSDDRDTVKAEVDAGRAELWCLDAGAAWMITRIEGRQLVVMNFQGSGLRKWSRVLFEQAQSQHLTSVRFHTDRPAIARLLPYDFEEIHRVFVYRLPSDG